MDITYIRCLLNMLSIEKTTDDVMRLEVGASLFGIDADLYGEWVKWNNERNLIPIEQLKLEWDSFTNNSKMIGSIGSTGTIGTIGIATLSEIAEIYNSKEFDRIKKLTESQTIQLIKHITHYSVAVLLDEKLKYKMKSNGLSFYFFNQHRWTKLNSTSMISRILSEDLASSCIEFGNHQIVPHLENSTFKMLVIKEYADIVYDPNFMNNLDENINLLCFDNGVYDWQTNRFRPGYPDDLVGITTKYNLCPSKMIDNQIGREIESYIDQLVGGSQRNKSRLLNLLCDSLTGSIDENELYVIVSNPRIYAIRFFQLIKEVFGDYFEYSNIDRLEKLTRFNQKGIRICLFSQLESFDSIKFLEQYNSQIHASSDLGNTHTYTYRPQFKSIFISENFPAVTSTLSSLKVSVINFNTNFELVNLRDKFVKWKSSFMSLLVDRRRNWKR